MTADSQYYDVARRIISTIGYMTLATVTPESEPWNTPVGFVHDEDWNIYWVSDKANQHSVNIASTGRAFIVIYDSTVPEGQGEGVYIQARAEQVTDPDEILRVRRIKKGPDYQPTTETFLDDSVRYMYRATPERIWTNEAEFADDIFIRDYRIELNIADLRSAD